VTEQSPLEPFNSGLRPANSPVEEAGQTRQPPKFSVPADEVDLIENKQKFMISRTLELSRRLVFRF
jgi:hypothetical protein